MQLLSDLYIECARTRVLKVAYGGLTGHCELSEGAFHAFQLKNVLEFQEKNSARGELVEQ